MHVLTRWKHTVTFRRIHITFAMRSLDTSAGKTNEMCVKYIYHETGFLTQRWNTHMCLFIQHRSNYAEYNIWKTKAYPLTSILLLSILDRDTSSIFICKSSKRKHCCLHAVVQQSWAEERLKQQQPKQRKTNTDTGRAWDSNMWFRLPLKSHTKRKSWSCSSAFTCDIMNNRMYQRYTLLYKATARRTNDTSLHCLQSQPFTPHTLDYRNDKGCFILITVWNIIYFNQTNNM